VSAYHTYTCCDQRAPFWLWSGGNSKQPALPIRSASEFCPPHPSTHLVRMATFTTVTSLSLPSPLLASPPFVLDQDRIVARPPGFRCQHRRLHGGSRRPPQDVHQPRLLQGGNDAPVESRGVGPVDPCSFLQHDTMGYMTVLWYFSVPKVAKDRSSANLP